MNYGKKGVQKIQHQLNSRAAKWGHKLVITFVKTILIAIVAVGIFSVSAVVGAFKGIIANTPDIPMSQVVASGEATMVYDCLGNKIDTYVSTNSNRIQVKSDAISQHLKDAFVACEDERFYQHNGIDFKGIMRSGYQFYKNGATQGASTITQQLLKNTVFTEWTSEGKNMAKKIKRKIQEQYLALQISKYFTKDEVLVRYMNAINLGQNTLGVQSASLRYFGKPCKDLTVSESAAIAVITQNPNKYNPLTHPDKNAERRENCLNKMLELEFITKAEYDAAIADTAALYERIGNHNEDFVVTEQTTSTYFSDALYEQVRADLIEQYGYSDDVAEMQLLAGGLRIESSFDPRIQAIVDEEAENPSNYPKNTKWLLDYALTIIDDSGEKHNFSKENMTTWYKENKNKNFNLIFSSQEAAEEGIALYRSAMFASLELEETEDNYEEDVKLTPQPQISIVIEDYRTGLVVAMAGGRGTKEGRRTLNRATKATRSPGSTFKVVGAFAPAMDACDQSLATIYVDKAYNYADGRPVHNWYGSAYRGNQTIRQAITASLNIIAVKTCTAATPQLCYDYLLNFGFTTLIDHAVINGQEYSDIRQPLALGGLTKGVTPFELNAAYSTIANGGLYVAPKLYKRVLNTEGDVILDNTIPTTRRVLKETTAYLLTDAMEDVVSGQGGTGGKCNFNKNMAIAGKTGTSTEYHDVWFAGYTPYYACTTWAGYDNNIGMNSSTEGGVAKTLWHNVMKRLHADLEDAQFEMPSGIVECDVCTRSGKLAIPGVCGTRKELMDESSLENIGYCDCHYKGEICAYDGKPACPECTFKYHGVCSLPYYEPGTGESWPPLVTIDEETGEVIEIETQSRGIQCQHNAMFYQNPDCQNILNQQAAEIEQRRIEAAARAAEEARIAAENAAAANNQ